MDDGYGSWRVFCYCAGILLLAVLYAFGAAVQQLNETELKKQKDEGDNKVAFLWKVVKKPLMFINTVSFATGFVFLICGTVILPWSGRGLENLFFPSGCSPFVSACLYGAAAVLMLWPFLILGVLFPKRFARRHPESVAVKLSGPVRAISLVFSPFVWFMVTIVRGIMKLLGWQPDQVEENVTEEEIMSMVNEGHEQGVIEAGEAEMITNIFEFGDKEAGDIMIHRTAMVVLDGELTLAQAMDQMLKSRNSRFPVYGEDIDDIIGIVHIRDVVACMGREPENTVLKEARGLLREPLFIPEVCNIDQLFSEMQSTKNHMVIVVDEYGQTAGLITMEDILEEIVGNIWDEYDVAEELIIKNSDGSFTLQGLAPLEDVAEALQIQFPEEEEEEIDTINGFLISQLDRIPREGERPVVVYEGYRFQVEKVENNRILTIHVEKESVLEAEEESE